uniref:Uncharacterized protein n=1 Tax=Cacopsylla melanoneura TaxID=428564 RepID=A0A8D8QMK5_9HEMI
MEQFDNTINNFVLSGSFTVWIDCEYCTLKNKCIVFYCSLFISMYCYCILHHVLHQRALSPITSHTEPNFQSIKTIIQQGTRKRITNYNLIGGAYELCYLFNGNWNILSNGTQITIFHLIGPKPMDS